MDKKLYRKWTNADRAWLRELAALHGSDDAIAKIMERTASAVGFQRSKLRIRLCGTVQGRRSGIGSWQSPVRGETDSRVERLLALAKRVTPSLHISEIQGFGASPFLDCDTLP